jgi:hypothetical protein
MQLFKFMSVCLSVCLQSCLSVLLSVCPPQLLWKKISIFYNNQQGGHAIEGDLDSIIFGPAASTISKWTFKLLTWMQNLHYSTWDHIIFMLIDN